MGTRSLAERSGERIDERVAQQVDEAIDEHPLTERITQLGWIAKGVVYVLMGFTAFTIARQRPDDDDASPTGSLARVVEQPGGRALVGVLALGLVLYALWRVLSVALIRGVDADAWADRVGYAFSAGFYAVLAWTAGRAALRGGDIGDDNTVERLSRSLMDTAWGRWAVGVAGVVTIAVGLYFLVRKSLLRGFADDVEGVTGDLDCDMFARVLLVAGVAGWAGRGVVTVLVGFFVTRSAIRFDPSDARGFDASLRAAATTTGGTAIVGFAAIGLILYGCFSLLSHRRRRLEVES